MWNALAGALVVLLMAMACSVFLRILPGIGDALGERIATALRPGGTESAPRESELAVAPAVVAAAEATTRPTRARTARASAQRSTPTTPTAAASV